MKTFLTHLQTAACAAGASGLAGAGAALAAIRTLGPDQDQRPPEGEPLPAPATSPEPAPRRTGRWEQITWPRPRAVPSPREFEQSLGITPLA